MEDNEELTQMERISYEVGFKDGQKSVLLKLKEGHFMHQHDIDTLMKELKF